MTTRLLEGWGRVLRSRSTVVEPDGVSGLVSHMAPREGGLIVHGGGRSYGDAALNAEGTALLTRGWDRVLSFDPATGAIEVEPGITFRGLIAAYLPRHFLSPVTPGTGFATIGGAVSHDVHGKNHEMQGSFGQHVTALDLLTPDGTRHTIGPDRDPDLFRATVGGAGLTGVITRVAFRMHPVPGPLVAVREERMCGLDDFLATMEARRGASYSVGWIDGTARGTSLGRGILETAEPVAGHLPPGGRAVRIPFDFPGRTLNPLSVRAFNALYYRRIPKGGRTRLDRYERFLYPLDKILEWNRIYGKGGFHQFQSVVPYESGAAALRALLEVVAETRQASFLAVLKRMGSGRAGYLSFPMPGYTLALDFPARPGVEQLYARLARITRAYGGRLYLAKDPLMTAGDLRAMYPELPQYQEVLARVDPGRLMRSDLARRLGL